MDDIVIASAMRTPVGAGSCRPSGKLGGTGSGSLLPWLIGLLVVVAVVVVVVLIVRGRRKGAPATDPDAVPLEELEKRAASALWRMNVATVVRR